MFPAGLYYIGDLCYVLTEKQHSMLVDLAYPSFSGPMVCGEFDLDGVTVASYGTLYGDGFYPVSTEVDGVFEHLAVDSGSIGCVPLSCIQKPVEQIGDLGIYVQFDRPFHTSSVDGVIRFGPITVDTTGKPEEYE